MSEQSVRVEVELCVERDHVAVAGDNQWIDLGERGIGFVEGAIEPL